MGAGPAGGGGGGGGGAEVGQLSEQQRQIVAATFNVVRDKAKLTTDKYRENVVFLNLWATWCGPCRYEIPELQKLHTEYAPQGFKVVGVSLDEGGKETVQQFVNEHAMSYPIARIASAY